MLNEVWGAEIKFIENRWKISICRRGCRNSKFNPRQMNGKACVELEPAQQKAKSKSEVTHFNGWESTEAIPNSVAASTAESVPTLQYTRCKWHWLHVVCDTSATAPAHSKDLVIFAGSSIRPSSTVRDLSVVLDSKLSFGPHINQLVSRCFLQLRRIKPCRWTWERHQWTVLSSPKLTTVTVCWPEFHAINSTGCSLWWTQQHD